MKKSLVIIKKICIIFIIIVPLLFILLFIKNINRSPKVGTWVIHKTNNNYVEMSVQKESITNKKLTVTLTNHTAERYIYGHSYTIEYYKNGFWHYLKPINEVSFLLNAIILDANSNKEIHFDWEDYYGELPKGKYRIIRKYTSEQSNNEFYVSADFIVK